MRIYDEREERVLSRMRRQGLDALVVNLPDNNFYLTGCDSIGYLWYPAPIVSPALDEPVFITRTTEEPVVWQMSNIRRAIFYDIVTTDPLDCLVDVLRKKGLDRGRIGLELQAFTFLPAQHTRLGDKLSGAEIVDASERVAEERVIKAPQEIAYQRQAAEMSDYAMGVAMDAIRPGTTELQLAGIISKAPGDAGSEISAISGVRRAAVGVDRVAGLVDHADVAGEDEAFAGVP